MKALIGWFARNHVAANLLMMTLIVGGISTLRSIPLKTFPDLDIEVIVITVPYLGAAPEEVERGVCIRIEEEIEGITGIDTIRSTASEGVCSVGVELLMGADPLVVLDRIKNRVDAISTFPEETEKPIVSQYVIRRAAVDIAISGNTDERSLKNIGERIRDDLLAKPGITQADLLYTRAYEISIEVSESSLRRYGLTFDEIARAVRRSSLDLPGGTIKAEGGEILIRSMGQAYLGKEYEKVVVLTREDGTRVTLGQIATIVDGFSDSDLYVDFDGKPAVLIRTFRVGDENSIHISNTVQEYIEEAQWTLPEGIDVTLWKDSSKSLRGRIDTLVHNGLGGLLLVLFLLAIFLRMHVAFWVSIGIPIAFLGAVWTMPLGGLSINVISLFAFIVVLGIVVDDAIVVGENIHTHQQRGENLVDASISGAQEVAIPVIFGVLTTVAAFFPLLVVPGPMGQVYAVIGYVVIACLVFSLVESQLVLPSHLARAKRRSDSTEPATGFWAERYQTWIVFQERNGQRLERLATDWYRPALQKAIEWRYTTLSVGLMLLLCTIGLLAGGHMKISFFPPIRADFVSARITLPRGTPFEQTREAVETIAIAARDVQVEFDESGEESVVQHILTATGAQGANARHGASGDRNAESHVGEVIMELTPSEDRKTDSGQVANLWRERVPPIPDLVELTYAWSRENAGEAVNIQLQGQNIEDLRMASQALQAELRTLGGVIDISDSFRGGKQEIKLTLRPQAETLGISLDDLARQVRQAFYGEEAQRIQRNRDDVRVMLRYPKDQRNSLSNLENMWIRTPDGDEVPFSSVAKVDLGRGFASIKRTDRQRVINVTADIDRQITNPNEVISGLIAGPLPEILSDYPGMSYSLQGEQREQRRSMGGLASAYIIALFAIYALLAIPLRSYLQPLIIMAVIPFGIVGAIGGHLFMGLFRPSLGQLSFMSVVGMVALSGVVVNSSLVLVDFINRRTKEGVPLNQAIQDAGILRFRPIILTSLTTFVGLSPLLVETSIQAQYLIPMAISLAYGVLFATLITLFLVPCSLTVIEDIGAGSRRKWETWRSSSPKFNLGKTGTAEAEGLE